MAINIPQILKLGFSRFTLSNRLYHVISGSYDAKTNTYVLDCVVSATGEKRMGYVIRKNPFPCEGINYFSLTEKEANDLKIQYQKSKLIF
jgi:hypothetical protein